MSDLFLQKSAGYFSIFVGFLNRFTMKRTLLITLLLVLSISGYAADTIRVACIGNSITYGSGIKNRAADSYPAVLGKLLGKTFKVSNFGVSGRTLLSKGDFPYIKEKAFKDALKSKPNVVIIKLGTNDTKPQNWKFQSDFKKDLAALVDTFAKLPSRPRVFLCLPAKAYGLAYGINDSIIENGVIPQIRIIAKNKRLTVIDMYKATSNMPANFPDKIHPNEKGARIMAETVLRLLRSDRVTSKYFPDVLPMDTRR